LATGDRYSGVWKNDYFMKGELNTVAGDKFTGSFYRFQPDGHTRVNYQDGNFYEGRVREGKREGLGRLEFKDGS